MKSSTVLVTKIPSIAFISLLIASLQSSTVYAQRAEQSGHDTEHGHHDHMTEIGISAGYVYLDHEEESAAGVDLHVIRRVDWNGLHNRIGLGAGIETVFADHLHYTAMGAITWYPYRTLSVALAPGILFVKHDNEWEHQYATHVEVSYGFFFGEYEIGPAAGFSHSGDDRHITVGIHIGKGF